MKKILTILLTVCAFAGCSKEGGSPNKMITVADESQLTQSAFADQVEGERSVNLTTTGAWTSTIETSTHHSAALALADIPNSTRTSQTSEWITISPDHGDAAGNYSIGISLQTNMTGQDRSAKVAISCNGTSIEISVSQKAVTEEGYVPTVPSSGKYGDMIWKIANNTLTISGTGAIPGDTYNVPWDCYNMSGTPQFEHVVIKEGITQIGYTYQQAVEGQSFYHCGEKVKTYDIAASVNVISPNVFNANTNIKKITLHWTLPPVLAAGPYTYNNTYAHHFGLPEQTVYSDIVLSVPRGSKASYEAMAGLRDFNIVER